MPLRRLSQAAAVAVVAALLALLVWDVANNHAGKVAKEVDTGHPYTAPLFTRPLVNGTGTFSLLSMRGKAALVVNFWQSYCAPCTHEARTLAAVSREWSHNKNVVFLGIDVQDLRGPARAFLKRFGITYRNVSDDGSLVGRFGVTGYPETFFIDRRGVVVPVPHVGHIIGPATRQLLNAGIRYALAT
ncbi:MAG: TlpA family protein disulfide reductase [Actinobacteria bacterium]|nr:TlpA family protein disulfide reductase [Actinomycetota bacterium]